MRRPTATELRRRFQFLRHRSSALADSASDKRTLADSASDKRTLADSASDKRTLADSASDKRTLADSASDKRTLADSASDKRTLADSASDKRTLADSAPGGGEHTGSSATRSRLIRHVGHAAWSIGLGLMLAVSAVPAQAQTSSAQSVEARGFLDAGKDAFRAKDYSRAAGFFQKAFAKDPSLTIALYNQAFALKKANLLAQARDVYDAYTKVKPDDADGFYGLADVYRLLGNEAEAIQTFNLYLAKETRSGKERYTTFAREYLAKAGAPAKAKNTEPQGFQAREAAKSADELYVAAGKQLREGKYSAAAASFATVYELESSSTPSAFEDGIGAPKGEGTSRRGLGVQPLHQSKPG